MFKRPNTLCWHVIKSLVLAGRKRFVPGGEKQRLRDDAAGVAARADKAGDNAERALGDKRYHAVRGPLTALHEQREHHHEADGARQGVLGEPHEDAKRALHGLQHPQRPQAPPHAKVLAYTQIEKFRFFGTISWVSPYTRRGEIP